MKNLYVIGRDSWVWEMPRHALASMHSSHGVGEYSVTAVWPLAGGLSRRRPHEIIEQIYILYIILLLDEGVAACAWRRGNMLPLAHFVALALVKSWGLKTSP